MMHPTLFAAALALILATPVQANIFGWLTGQKTHVECAPTDRTCLIDETIEMVFSNAAKREVAQNTATTARQLVDLAAMLPPSQAKALRQRIIDADEDPSFLKNYDHYRSRNAPAPDMPMDRLVRILGAGPDGNETYGPQVNDGFTAALARGQSNEAIELWLAHGDQLWKRGGRAYQLVQNWMAENDSALFERYTNRYSLFRRSKQKTYEALGRIALVHCRTDNKNAGRRVLHTVQSQFDAYAWKDPVIKLYAQAELYAATLYCHGLPRIERLQKNLDEMSAAARAFVIETYPNEREQAFVLEALHDTVELRTWRVLAIYHYVDLNDPIAARNAFETGQASQGVYSIATSSDGALVPQPEAREALPFETFERDIETIHRFDPVPDIALRYFMAQFEIATLEPFAQTGYYVGDYLSDYGDQIDALWPAPLAIEAATKSVRIAAEISASDADYTHVIDRVLLRLASLPQPVDCALSEARLQQMLDRLPGYRFGDTRVETMLIHLRYLNRSADEGTLCAIAEAMR